MSTEVTDNEKYKNIRHEYKKLVDEDTYNETKELIEDLSLSKKISYLEKQLAKLQVKSSEEKKVSSRKKSSGEKKSYKRRSKEEIDALVDKNIKDDPRYKELNKMHLKKTRNYTGITLYDFATKYNIPKSKGGKNLSKGELIQDILAYERRNPIEKSTDEVVDEVKEIIESDKPKKHKKSSESIKEQMKEQMKELEMIDTDESDDIKPKKKKKEKQTDDSDESDDLKPKKKKVQEETKEEVEEEEEVKTETKTESGDYSKQDLEKMSISELQQILKSKGIKKARLRNEQHGVDLISSLSSIGKMCDTENPDCGEDAVCDLSSKPGICLDKKSAVKDLNWIEYKGKQIVGSERAIDKLRKKLGVEKTNYNNEFYEDDDLDKRRKLLTQLKEVSGRSKNKDFENLSNKQLKKILKIFNSEKTELLTELSLAESNKSISELKQEALDMKRKYFEKENKKRGKLVKKIKDFGGDEDGLESLSLSDLETRVSESENKYNERRNKAMSKIRKAGGDEDGLESLSLADLETRLSSIKEDKNKRKAEKQRLISEIVSLGEDDEKSISELSLEDLQSKLSSLTEKRDSKKKKKLIKKIRQISDIDKDSLSSLSNEELESKLSEEQSKKGDLVNEIVKITGEPDENYDDKSYNELLDIKKDLLRRKMAEALNSSKGKSLDYYLSLSDEKLKKKYDKLMKKSEKSTSEEEEEEEEVKTKESKISSDEEEEEEKEVIKIKKSDKGKDIGSKDVEKLLSEVVSGKNGETGDFTDVQKAVLKCLGILNN